MQLVTVFVAVAIILGIAVAILGETSSAFDCATLSGAPSIAKAGSPTAEEIAKATGWSKACFDVGEQAQGSFQLLVVLLIVIAAVAILVVVRMLY